MTLKRNDGKIVQGSRSKPGNKMSIPEYEVLSQGARSLGYRPIGNYANSNLLPDFYGVHEIEQKEVFSNERTSVEIADELTI